jgi:hypothetical protein
MKKKYAKHDSFEPSNMILIVNLRVFQRNSLVNIHSLYQRHVSLWKKAVETVI